MKITNEERDILLSEIVEAIESKYYDPEIHVTLKDIAKALGMSDNGARNRMDKLVRSGEYEKVLVTHPDYKNPVTAYKKP